MTSFKKTVDDIKSLKIQGAQNVAVAAVSSLKQVLKESKTKDAATLWKNILRAKKILFDTRPTEPAMRNALDYVVYDLKAKNAIDLAVKLNHRIDHALHYFKESKKKIQDFGEKKIRDGMIVYTHCHSSTVTGILKAAKNNGKSFMVNNTETRPLYQGRVTAMELADAGITVNHFVDSAARIALKKADIMLIGADAITAEGKVVNKIGSELFAETADRFGVPVYVCANSWKFDPLTVRGFEEVIERRHASEVWKNPPSKVKINNLAFEQIDPNLITGVITELGVYKPEVLIQEVKDKFPWMF